MKAIVFAPAANLPWYLTSAVYAGLEPVEAETISDFGSALFRDADTLGLLCLDARQAPGYVRGLRQGDIKNRLLVLIETMPADAPWLAASFRAATLKAGADDCQPADLDARELTARLKTLMERGDYIDHRRIVLPSAMYDHDLGAIESVDGRLVHLTPTEGKLLVDLARHPAEVRSKAQIIDALYGGEDDEPAAKIVDVLICKLRRKVMEATGGVDVVRTIWGQGYSFDAAGFQPEMHVTRRRAGETRRVGQ